MAADTKGGTICRVVDDKMFCFIKPDDGQRDVFAHVTGFVDYIDPFDATLVGRRVEYRIEDAAKGPRAVEVKLQ